MKVSLLNFFYLKPLNTSKRALNPNHPFFWDTLYISCKENTQRKHKLPWSDIFLKLFITQRQPVNYLILSEIGNFKYFNLSWRFLLEKLKDWKLFHLLSFSYWAQFYILNLTGEKDRIVVCLSLAWLTLKLCMILILAL